MIRLLLRAVIFLGSAALGLWVASLLLDDVHLHAGGVIVAIVVFAVVQSVLTPFFAMLIKRHATAFLGGVGLISTIVALLLATLVSDGLSITGGFTNWVLATLIVWIVTALATLLLPMVLLKKAVQTKRTRSA